MMFLKDKCITAITFRKLSEDVMILLTNRHGCDLSFVLLPWVIKTSRCNRVCYFASVEIFSRIKILIIFQSTFSLRVSISQTLTVILASCLSFIRFSHAFQISLGHFVTLACPH